MSAQRIADIRAATATYLGSDGKTKHTYCTIGHVMRFDDGTTKRCLYSYINYQALLHDNYGAITIYENPINREGNKLSTAGINPNSVDFDKGECPF